MDGTIGDYFANGRRLRPATLDYATQNFPRLILRSKQEKLSVSYQQQAGNPDVIQAISSISRFEKWVILKSDFDLCKKIADKVELRLFRSDNETVVLDKILAYVKIEFAGRGVPV